MYFYCIELWNKFKAMSLKNKISIYNLTVPQLLLILGSIILLTPMIFTLIGLWGFWDFSKTGQIGDTLGGITSPFISALAALLVFAAFKEQVTANKLLKENLSIELLHREIHRLEDDIYNIKNLKEKICVSIKNEALSEGSPIKRPGVDINDLLIIKHIHQMFSGLMIKSEELLNSTERDYYTSRISNVYAHFYLLCIDEIMKNLLKASILNNNAKGIMPALLKSINNFRLEIKAQLIE